jgi:hypothetical protein
VLFYEGTFEVGNRKVGMLKFRKQIVEEAPSLPLLEKRLVFPNRTKIRSDEYGYHIERPMRGTPESLSSRVGTGGQQDSSGSGLHLSTVVCWSIVELLEEGIT